MLKTKTVQVGDQEFELHELSMPQMLPILRVIKDDPDGGQFQIFSLSVWMNGEPLGETGLADIGVSTYMALAPHVMALNGMAIEELASGNG